MAAVTHTSRSGCFTHRAKAPRCSSIVAVQRRVVAQAGFGFGAKQKGTKADQPCVCGSDQPFKACCQLYLDSADGQVFSKRPPTAEACLRAQFSAYALKKHRFILKTTSKDNPSRKGSDSEDGKVHRTFEQDVKATCQWANFRNFNLVQQREDEEVPGNVLLAFEMETRMVYDLQTGNQLKDAPWQQLQQTARFVHDPEEGWLHLKTEKSNWDREKLQVVA